MTLASVVRGCQRGGEGGGVDQAEPVHGQPGDLPAVPLQHVDRVQHGVVLGRRGDDVPAARG